MNKCNNCAKFLTCDRRKCNQITFLQAGQLDRLEVKQLKIDIEYDARLLSDGLSKFGMTLEQALNNLKDNCLKISIEEENRKINIKEKKV